MSWDCIHSTDLDQGPGGILSLGNLQVGKYVWDSERKALPSSLKNTSLGQI